MRTSNFHREAPQLTAEDATRVEAFAERENVKARQAALVKAREDHREWLRSIGIDPPRPIVIVPDAPTPKRRGRPRRRA